MTLQRLLSGGKCPTGYEKSSREGYCRKISSKGKNKKVVNHNKSTGLKTLSRFPVSKVNNYLNKALPRTDINKISLNQIRARAENSIGVDLSSPEFRSRFKEYVLKYYSKIDIPTSNQPNYDTDRKCSSSARTSNRYTKPELVIMAKQAGIKNASKMKIDELCKILKIVN